MGLCGLGGGYYIPRHDVSKETVNAVVPRLFVVSSLLDQRFRPSRYPIASWLKNKVLNFHGIVKRPHISPMPPLLAQKELGRRGR